MFLSVVIPSYNRALSLQRALLSLQSQTSQDFDVVVVDDGSTDQTRQIVQPFLCSRFHYVYQDNSERSVARNKGITHATGQYIYFLDSDDILLPNHVSQFIDTSYLHNFPPVIASLSTLTNSRKISNANISGFQNVLDATILLHGNPFSCNFGIKSDSLRHHFSVDKSIITMEDWVFLFENVFPDRSIVLMPSPTVVMTDHSGRSMYNHPVVIHARQSASAYLLSHYDLSPRQSRILTSNTNLFIAVHHRISGSYSASFSSLSKVRLLDLSIVQLRTFLITLIRLVFAFFLQAIHRLNSF